MDLPYNTRSNLVDPVSHIKPTAAKIAARTTPGSSRVIPGCKAWAADDSSPLSLSLSEAAVSPGAAAAFAVRRLAFIDVRNLMRGGGELTTARCVVVIIIVVVRGSRCSCSTDGGGGYVMLVRSVHQGVTWV